jgi:hypothetical protein
MIGSLGVRDPRALLGQNVRRRGGAVATRHGLAVRARSDMLMVFTAEGPSAEGTIPKSAVASPQALSILDHQLLEFLAKVPKVIGHPQGLEVTQLRLRPSVVLAESHMFAMAHALMFYVAAAEQFDGRDDLPDHHTTPTFPGYSSTVPTPTTLTLTRRLGCVSHSRRYRAADPAGRSRYRIPCQFSGPLHRLRERKHCAGNGRWLTLTPNVLR